MGHIEALSFVILENLLEVFSEILSSYFFYFCYEPKNVFVCFIDGHNLVDHR
jgi:hypothetical protein